MEKAIIGVIGVFLYKYLPRWITFLPLGISKVIACIAMIIGYLIYDQKLQKDLRKKFSHIRFFILGIGLWLVQTILMSVILTLIYYISGYQVSFNFGESIAMAPCLYSLIAIIFGPITEEFLFRGLIQDGLAELSGKKGWKIFAIILTSIFFGCLHQIPAQRISAMITGCVFGVIYEKKKDIRYGCMLHIGNNFMATVLSYMFAGFIL